MNHPQMSIAELFDYDFGATPANVPRFLTMSLKTCDDTPVEIVLEPGEKCLIKKCEGKPISYQGWVQWTGRRLIPVRKNENNCM